MISILIPSHVEAKVGRRLERLAKKAGVSVERIPGETTVFQTTDHRFYSARETEHSSKTGRLKFWSELVTKDSLVMECARYTIGEMPVAAGYTFVAKIAHTEGGNLISAAPGEYGKDLPLELREAAPTCDHCAKQRRRNETFVLRTPEGKLYRCGRNCLADFLKVDPTSIIASAELASFFDHEPSESDDESRGWGGGWGLSTGGYLAAAVSAVEHHGFIKSGEDYSTKSRANFLTSPKPRGRHSEDLAREWDKEQPTAAHHTLAETIMAWAETIEPGASDYLHNLKVALRCGVAAYDRRGILASAPSAYARAMGFIAENKARAARVDGGHFGKIGERLETVATVLRLNYSPGYGGTTKTIVTFVNDEGQDLTWFATGSAPSTDDVGKRFAIKGTIKKHDSYKGRAQTVLSRVVWESVGEESKVA